MKSFADILAETQRIGPRKVAIAGQPDAELNEALQRAAGLGIAAPVVFETADAAARAVRDGAADVFMKGGVDTPAFMKAVLNKDHDFRTGKLISHVLVIEALGRLMLLTDCGICIAPGLEEKAEIIRNALPIARRLGLSTPRVAVLASVEKASDKLPATVDAAKLTEMDFGDCHVQGPLALDLAISPAAAKIKGLSGPVVGRADILVLPSIEAGNIFAKSLMYFANVPSGGVVAGAKRPVTFSSRSDTADTKLHTIALGVLMSGR